MNSTYYKHLILLVYLVLSVPMGFSQERLKFTVTEFSEDPFDLSAKDKRYERFDGNGDRYAIIKVISNNPDDRLNEYNFNFGNMKHIVEEHDGVLWVYVQRNAKLVTITREGYAPVNRYDLHTTLESGKNYLMSLTSEERRVLTQMVQFNVTPANSRAIVMVKPTQEGASEEIFGTVDTGGSVARSLRYGTYSYKVVADNYHMAEGRFTLNDKAHTFVENVTLRPNYSDMVLKVDADAGIYVDGELKGTRQWSGALKAGTYQVECRQPNHRPTSQYITVTDNDSRTIELAVPEPILGTVAVTSIPLGAEIMIDGKSYGQTPRNLEIVTGGHTLELSKSGYKTEKQEFQVTEDRQVDLNISLSQTGTTLIESNPSGAEVSIDGVKVGRTPYTYEGSIGERQVRLSSDGYKPSERQVYLGGTAKETFSLQWKKPYLRKNDFYVEAGIGFVQGLPDYITNLPLNLTLTLGYHIRHFNMEIFFNYLNIAQKDTVYEILDYSIGLKLGYSFNAGRRCRITPQVGFGGVQCQDEYDDTYREAIIPVGVRVFYALTERFGISLTPEYYLSGTSWFNAKLGFVVTF